MTTIMSSPATRMPFGEINGARLQSLTSTKNRQNALTSLSSPLKRKATESFPTDLLDAENIDPLLISPKRAKPASDFTFTKPSSTTLFVKPTTPALPTSRKILTPKLNTSTIRAPSSAPAGRSPTNKKRTGILSRRRTIQRISPPPAPSFSLSPASAAPFSLTAALAGTIPSYTAKAPPPMPSAKANSSWDFLIHEDTPEEEMQILMEHGACTLDISSDEEVELKARDERGKENVPPSGHDVSQSRSTRRERKLEACDIEVDRAALGELFPEEFYDAGVGSEDVVFVCEDEEYKEEDVEVGEVSRTGQQEFAYTVELAAEEVKGKSREMAVDEEAVEALMSRRPDEAAVKAAVLQPLERAEEGFEVWESGSAKGDE